MVEKKSNEKWEEEKMRNDKVSPRKRNKQNYYKQNESGIFKPKETHKLQICNSKKKMLLPLRKPNEI